MKENQIKITFHGMDSSEAMKSYILEKIGKFDNFLEKVTFIEIVFTENIHNKGIATDYKVEINAVVPRTNVFVEEIGDNMYALIDKASDVFARRLKRYFEKTNQWEGKEPWKYLEAEAQFENEEEDDDDDISFATYIPKISVRRKIKEMRPMEEAEAIEYMELSGSKQILFKNLATGQFSMIYKLENGSYCLEEPDEELTA